MEGEAEQGEVGEGGGRGKGGEEKGGEKCEMEGRRRWMRVGGEMEKLKGVGEGGSGERFIWGGGGLEKVRVIGDC